MWKKGLIVIGALLLVFLLYRDCGRSKEIAYLEGRLSVSEETLKQVNLAFDTAKQVWAGRDKEYQEALKERDTTIAIQMGNIDSLNTELTHLDAEYTSLEQSGASCGQLLANMTLQRDSWKEQAGNWKGAYEAEHTLVLTLQPAYEAAQAALVASENRNAALETVNTDLRRLYSASEKARKGLQIQGKTLKIVALGAGIYLGGKALKVL